MEERSIDWGVSRSQGSSGGVRPRLRLQSTTAMVAAVAVVVQALEGGRREKERNLMQMFAVRFPFLSSLSLALSLSFLPDYSGTHKASLSLSRSFYLLVEPRAVARTHTSTHRLACRP